MYYPILRGKQFELLALRDLAPHIHPHFVRPILEPVRDNYSALAKTIELLNEHDIQPIVIINPSLGNFVDLKATVSIAEDLTSSYSKPIRFLPCITTKGLDAEKVKALSDSFAQFSIFIEEDYESELFPVLEKALVVITTTRYRKAFHNLNSVVLIEDGFSKQSRNSDYPDRSFFSELHTEYSSTKNVTGFGDYTITGSHYLESGGPAYVVAIHLPYIDSQKEDAMYVRHFRSYDDRSPTQPGEKFGDALRKLVQFTNENPNLVFNTLAIKAFRRLHKEDHFPGLGSVKKLSISHHIETTAMYLSSESNE